MNEFTYTTKLNHENIQSILKDSVNMYEEFRLMKELSNCFVGFSISPVGLYNKKTYQIMSMEFDTKDELISFVHIEKGNYKAMLLYVIYSTDDKFNLRFTYV